VYRKKFEEPELSEGIDSILVVWDGVDVEVGSEVKYFIDNPCMEHTNFS
jgi:hypothetical protein